MSGKLDKFLISTGPSESEKGRTLTIRREPAPRKVGRTSGGYMTELQQGIAASRPVQAGETHALTTLAGCGWALLAVAIWSGWLVITRVAVTSTLTAEDLSALRFGSAGL